MNFKEMDPEVIRSLLDERDEKGNLKHPDVIAPAIEREQSFFRTASCPKCREGSTETFVDPRRPFVSGQVLPRRQLRCLSCRTEFDPYTGLILKVTSSPA